MFLLRMLNHYYATNTFCRRSVHHNEKRRNDDIMSTASQCPPASTTNVAFIARPSFESSLDERRSTENDDDVSFDNDDFDKSDADNFLPNFKTVVLNDSAAKLPWPSSKHRPNLVLPKPHGQDQDEQNRITNSEPDDLAPVCPEGDLNEVRGSEDLASRASGVTVKFFDFRTEKWVEVENFSFSEGQNHFVDEGQCFKTFCPE